MNIGQPGEEVTYKVLLIGESGVGKTSLIRSLTGSPFSHNMLSTVGIDFVRVPFEVDGAKVRLQIWDTAGQERFRSITRFQYRATKGLLLVYDVTKRETFDTLSYWINTIEKDFDQSNREPIPVIMVGNKCDLVEQRMVSTSEGKKVAEKNFLSGFWETSAADGTNVKQCFQQLAHAVTEVYNPQLMDMYRFSTAIDLAKRMTNCQLNPDVIDGSPSPPTPGKNGRPIKLSSKSQRQKKSCNCKPN